MLADGRRFSRAFVLLTLLSILGTAGVLEAQEADAAVPTSCSDLLLVFARGSGQTIDDDRSLSSESSKFFSEIRSHTPEGLSISEYRLGDPGYGGYSYPAVGMEFNLPGPIRFLANYPGSVVEGANELGTLLTDRHSQCPDEEWIIGGYSQGGEVISSTLRALPTDVRDHVGFAATFGDPTLEAYGGWPCKRAWYARGNVRCYQHGILGPVIPYVPDDVRGRFGAWCDWLDPVCAMGPDLSFEAHKRYKEAAIPAAAVEALSVVRFEHSWTLRELTLGNGTTGADVMIVFDTTGSMYDAIESAQEASLRIADQVLSLPNGRIGLVQYRDLGDEPPMELVSGLTSDPEGFAAAVNSLYADGGGDWEEAMLGGIMTALNGVSWKEGATKLLVIIGDAPAKDPDPVWGVTSDDVISRANEIDPVGLYGVDTCGCGASVSMEPLAEGTGGAVIAGIEDVDETFEKVLEDASVRPVVQIQNIYYAEPGQTVTFSAEGSYDPDSTISEYRWDLNGDGAFEITTTEPFAEHVYLTEEEVSAAVVAVSADGGTGAGQTTVIIEEGWSEAMTPGAPISPTLREVGLGTVQVEWQKPSAGPAPTSYLISDSDDEAVAMTDASTRAVAIDGLDPGSRQQFSIRAITNGKVGAAAQTPELTLSVPSTKPASAAPGTESAITRRRLVAVRLLTKRTKLKGRRLWFRLLCPRIAVSRCQVALSAGVPGQGRFVRRRRVAILPGKVAKVELTLPQKLISGADPVTRVRLLLQTRTQAGMKRGVAIVTLRH